MKQLLTLLALMPLVFQAAGQFADTTELNHFIRDTIKDRRPERVTAAQVQKGLLGISKFLKPDAIIKAGNGIATFGDSVYLGGSFENIIFLGLNEGYYSPVVSVNPATGFEVYVQDQNGHGSDFHAYTNSFGIAVSDETGNTDYRFLKDSFFIQRNIPGYPHPVTFYIDGRVRLNKFKNNISEDSVLSVDQSGFLELKKFSDLLPADILATNFEATGSVSTHFLEVANSQGDTLLINGNSINSTYNYGTNEIVKNMLQLGDWQNGQSTDFIITSKYSEDGGSTFMKESILLITPDSASLNSLFHANGGITLPLLAFDYADTAEGIGLPHGEIRISDNYLYVRVSTGWKRVALESFFVE